MQYIVQISESLPHTDSCATVSVNVANPPAKRYPVAVG